jgi:hypothetical protein
LKNIGEVHKIGHLYEVNMKLFFRKIIGNICRPFSIGYSDCGRCHRTWNICKNHNTQYSKSYGCFPICEACWKELTPNERFPYYQRLIELWMFGSHDDNGIPWNITKENIEKAVLSGK